MNRTVDFRSQCFWVLLLLALSLAWPVSAAEGGKLVLGSEGTIFKLHKGPYGELFPDGATASGDHGDNEVLALDVIRASGARERWLVPNTESQDTESSEFLVFDPESNRVYLLWETLVNGIHPLLRLTSFDGYEWGELLEIISDPFSNKGSPQLVVSRASAAGPSPEAVSLETVTVLHLVWWQERPDTSQKRYAPIFIVDGEYLDVTSVLDLSALTVQVEGMPAGPISPGLVDAIRVQIGKNSHSCVVGFLDPITHRLVTLDIEVLPPDLASLADKARLEILPLGMKSETPADLAEALVARLRELGEGPFHEAALSYMAERIRGILGLPGNELTEERLLALADQIQQEIIGVGARIAESGLAEPEDFQILAFGSPWEPEAPRHLLKVSTVSARAAPEVGGPATLWLSETGEHVLVTWEEGDRIFYVESVGEGWSEPSSLELSPDLGRAAIYETLAERIRSR